MRSLSLLFIVFALAAAPLRAFAAPDDLEYFKQFIYKVEVDNSDPDFPTSTYRYLMAGSPDLEFQVGEGKFVGPMYQLYLKDDFTFIFDYTEMIHTKDAQGHDSYMPGGCERLEGTWSVPDTDLVLQLPGEAQPLMTASRYMDGPREKILAKFGRDLFSPVLVSHPIITDYGFSNAGPESWFCFNFPPSPQP